MNGVRPMFLSKRSNGVYYLWYTDESGKKCKGSTKTCSKSEVQRFLRNFIRNGKQQKSRLSAIPLSLFQAEFLTYSASTHSPKTRRAFLTAFREFTRIVGDKAIRFVNVRDVEQFLSVKKKEASDTTARVCFVTPTSAFQTAVRWKYLHSNPFRQVGKPSPPEQSPVYLGKEGFTAIQKVTDVDTFIRKVIRVGRKDGLTTKRKKG